MHFVAPYRNIPALDVFSGVCYGSCAYPERWTLPMGSPGLSAMDTAGQRVRADCKSQNPAGGKLKYDAHLTDFP